mgnify:CR=1 FL=1
MSIQGLKARLGELAAALGGVDPHSRQPVELLDGQNDRLVVYSITNISINATEKIKNSNYLALIFCKKGLL